MRTFPLVVVAGAVSAVAVAPAFAERGDILVRGRLVTVAPIEDADIDPIGGDVDISVQVVPEVDISYFFTDRFAVELIAAITPHEVEANNTALGTVELGDVRLLPPTLTAQYHHPVTPKLTAYGGVGVNYTTFFGADLPSGSAVNSIDYDDSVGFAIQAGVDYALNEKWVFNIDFKRLDVDTDVRIDAGDLGIVNAAVDIDPILVGVGVGRRF